MSIEASVEELYGDSQSNEWKMQEVARLKAEQGIVELVEASVGGNELKDVDVENNLVDNTVPSEED